MTPIEYKERAKIFDTFQIQSDELRKEISDYILSLYKNEDIFTKVLNRVERKGFNISLIVIDLHFGHQEISHGFEHSDEDDIMAYFEDEYEITEIEAEMFFRKLQENAEIINNMNIDFVELFPDVDTNIVVEAYPDDIFITM